MRERWIRFSLIAGLMLAAPVGSSNVAHAISLEEAYKAIPHSQTTYQQSKSTLPKDAAASFEEFFHIVDLAVICRVEALQILRTSRGRVEKQITDLRRFGQRLKEFKLPDESAEVARLVGNAVMDEYNYLNSVARGDRQQIQSLHSDLRVQSASEKLRQAHSVLVKTYPKESAQNLTAFYDHLCALDFL